MPQNRLERDYQAGLIQRLEDIFPGIFVLKNDSGYLQGVPDLVLLYQNMWAVLEVKPSRKARQEPNQEYYVALLNEMSYAAFIYPENEEDVFHDLQQAFSTARISRSAQRK